MDEIEVEAKEVVVGVDTVASGAGDGGNDGAVLASYHIDKGAFANIWTSDDSYAGESVGGVVIARVEVFHQCVEEVSCAAAGDAGNRVGVAQSKRIELGEGVHLGGVVHLVGGKHHRLGTFAQHLGNVLIHGGESFAGVDEEKDDVGLIDGQRYLLPDFHLKFVVAPHDVAAGVDDGESFAVPIGMAVLAIAGDASGFIDDGVTALGEAVEEGGLADVRASNYGDNIHSKSVF